MLCYASFVLSNLPRASITPWLHAARLPFLNLTLVIPGIVSLNHVHCQSKSITIYHEAYAVDTLKVEIEAVNGRNMSFSHSYHNPLRFLVR